MIYLRFPENNVLVENWRERLDQLIVSYKLECRPDLEAPVIFENERSFTGVAAIERFLKELEEDVKDWRTPRCGV